MQIPIPAPVLIANAKCPPDTVSRKTEKNFAAMPAQPVTPVAKAVATVNANATDKAASLATSLEYV